MGNIIKRLRVVYVIFLKVLKIFVLLMKCSYESVFLEACINIVKSITM